MRDGLRLSGRRLVSADRAVGAGHRRRVAGLRVLRARPRDQRHARHRQGRARRASAHSRSSPSRWPRCPPRPTSSSAVARAAISVVNAFAWSALTLLTGLVSSAWGLAGVLLADGATTGTVQATHTPLLMDTHPPSVRVRVLSFYRAPTRWATSPRRSALRCSPRCWASRGAACSSSSVAVSLLAAFVKRPPARPGRRQVGHRPACAKRWPADDAGPDERYASASSRCAAGCC